MTQLKWLAAASTGLVGVAYVQAAQFATLDEVARRSFPEASFKEVLIVPTAEDLHALPNAPARQAPYRVLQAFKGEQQIGIVVVDAVIGKFELIDYAVALGADGHIRNVEILNYRESHGYEIKLPAWRNQFTGKTAMDKLRIGEDIANISGATLSCTHVTDGVRRIVMLTERLRNAGRL